MKAARAAVLGALVALLTLLMAAALAACERHADLREDTPGDIDIGPSLDAGDIPDIDAGLGGDAQTPCEARDNEPGCVGPVDFPCAFAQWAQMLVDDCQQAIGCTANGWVEVTMGGGGCVTGLGMNQPSQPLIDCLAAAVGEARCPCGPEVETVYLGEGNDGCGGE